MVSAVRSMVGGGAAARREIVVPFTANNVIHRVARVFGMLGA